MPSSSSPPPPSNQKPYGVTNIKAYVPLILDLNELNYDAWRELMVTHCRGFGVLNFLNGKSTPKDEDDEEWYTMDAIVKSWLYGTLTQPLLNMILKTEDSIAKYVWESLQSLFRDNKHAGAIELENELRTLVLGDQTISIYCSRFKTIADLFRNIEAPIPEATLVSHIIAGLPKSYSQVALLLRHKDPPPTFLQARSMLLVEEQQINRARTTQAEHKDHSSSPTSLQTGTSSTSANRNSNNNSGRGRGNSDRGRGRGRGGRGRG